MLPQGYRPDFEPLLNELAQPDRRSGGLEGEVAKWQNRMIPILPELRDAEERSFNLADEQRSGPKTNKPPRGTRSGLFEKGVSESYSAASSPSAGAASPAAETVSFTVAVMS